MTDTIPTTELDTRFSDQHASPATWDDAREILQTAEVFWLSTVRSDGRPHVTPLIAVWLDDALLFTTGEGEQKFVNLGTNPHVVLTTGRNTMSEGLDVVVEGVALRILDNDELVRIAEAYARKYGQDWAFEARDGALHHAEGGAAIAFRVDPVTVFGFAKGGPFSQTKWRF